MTSQKIAIGLAVIALFVGGMSAHAADYDAGFKAYQRGDYATALPIFRQLADQGHAKAQYKLGAMYERGNGVAQDYGAAVRWFRKAANQSNARAQYDLGVMYNTGKGVPQDYVQAHMWFNLAAAMGQKFARETRDLLAKKMTPSQIAEAQRLAREWYRKGSKIKILP